MISLLAEQSFLLSLAAGLSVVLLLLSIIAAPWLVSRLPADYLLQSAAPLTKQNRWRLLTSLLRNIIAALLLIIGLIMLVAPGPGVVMLLLALTVARVPGKQRLIHTLATRESVFNSLNWMRRRHNKPPLIHPDA